MYPGSQRQRQRGGGGGRQPSSSSSSSGYPPSGNRPPSSSSPSAFARGVALISPRGILNQSRRFFDDYQRRRERSVGFGRQPRRYRPLLARDDRQDGFQTPRFLSSWLRGPGGVLLLFSIVSLWFTMRTLDQFTHQTHIDHRDKHVSRKFCEERQLVRLKLIFQDHVSMLWQFVAFFSYHLKVLCRYFSFFQLNQTV